MRIIRDLRRAEVLKLFVNAVKHTPDEIEKMIKDGTFQQSVHVAAWLLALREL